jgi:hypothetical protein
VIQYLRKLLTSIYNLEGLPFLTNGSYKKAWVCSGTSAGLLLGRARDAAEHAAPAVHSHDCCPACTCLLNCSSPLWLESAPASSVASLELMTMELDELPLEPRGIGFLVHSADPKLPLGHQVALKLTQNRLPPEVREASFTLVVHAGIADIHTCIAARNGFTIT